MDSYNHEKKNPSESCNNYHTGSDLLTLVQQKWKHYIERNLPAKLGLKCIVTCEFVHGRDWKTELTLTMKRRGINRFL